MDIRYEVIDSKEPQQVEPAIMLKSQLATPLMQYSQLQRRELGAIGGIRHRRGVVRNANRLMIRYGIPVTMPSDIVSTRSQIDYIDLPQGRFDQRNLRELGYLPYKEKQRVGTHEVSYYPVMESLHIDPYDPLDP